MSGPEGRPGPHMGTLRQLVRSQGVAAERGPQTALSKVCANEASPPMATGRQDEMGGGKEPGPREPCWWEAQGGPHGSHGQCHGQGPTHDDVQSRRLRIVRAHRRKTHTVC